MNPQAKHIRDCDTDCIPDDCACNFDLVYIELTDLQKQLSESTKNFNKEGKKMTEIFRNIRQVLNIKHGKTI